MAVPAAEDNKQLLKSSSGRTSSAGADVESQEGEARKKSTKYRWLLTAFGVAFITGLVILVHSLVTHGGGGEGKSGSNSGAPPPLQPCDGAYSLCYQLPDSLRERLNVEIFYWSEKMSGPYFQANLPLLTGIYTKDEGQLIRITQAIAASLMPVNVTLDNISAEDHVSDDLPSRFPFTLSLRGPSSPTLQASADTAASVLNMGSSPFATQMDILILGKDAPNSRNLASGEANQRVFQGTPSTPPLQPTTFTVTDISLWFTPTRKTYHTTADIEECMSLWEHITIFQLGGP